MKAEVAGVDPAVADRRPPWPPGRASSRGAGWGSAGRARRSRPVGSGRSSSSRISTSTPGAGPAHGEQRLVVVGVERGGRPDAAGLGRRVADRVGGADALARLAHERRRGQGAAHDDGLDRATGRSSSKSGWRSSSASWGATPPMLAMWWSAIEAQHVGGPPAVDEVQGRGPTRRYHGSLVMKPMWANWVPDSIGPPAVPAAVADVGRGDRRQLALAEHGALGACRSCPR